MAENTLFLIHPDTGEVHTVKEAAKILNITTLAVYGRVRRGETGHKLWRPKGLSARFVETKEPSKHNYVKCYSEEVYIG